MRNLKITIEYDGTNYAGWQVQKSHQSHVTSHQPRTIQETIERALQKILQEKIRLIASGRTDAGVHALAQVANFTTASKIDLSKLHRALNGNLPEDIKISKIEEVDLKFNSRFSAKSKVYRYTILNRAFSSPFLRSTAHFLHCHLDLALMRKEARAILGRHDFTSFTASGGKKRNSLKTIKKIKITKKNNLISIEIEADGFLYKMVRNIVGTLIEIGRGEFSRGSLKKILAAQDRKMAGPAAPARGLLLVKVKY